MNYKYTKAEELYLNTHGKKKTVEELAKDLGISVKKVKAFVDKLPEPAKPAKSFETDSIPAKAGFDTHKSGAVMMNEGRSTKDDTAPPAISREEYLRLNKDHIHIINPNLPTN